MSVALPLIQYVSATDTYIDGVVVAQNEFSTLTANRLVTCSATLHLPMLGPLSDLCFQGP